MFGRVYSLHSVSKLNYLPYMSSVGHIHLSIETPFCQSSYVWESLEMLPSPCLGDVEGGIEKGNKSGGKQSGLHPRLRAYLVSTSASKSLSGQLLGDYIEQHG